MKKLNFLVFIFFSLMVCYSCENQTESSATPETPTTLKSNSEKTKPDVDYVGRMIKRIQKSVELTDEQVTAIQQIGNDFDFTDLNRQAYVQKKRAFKKRIYSEVLTEDQIKVLEKK